VRDPAITSLSLVVCDREAPVGQGTASGGESCDWRCEPERAYDANLAPSNRNRQ
jgi:hypothetical protein